MVMCWMITEAKISDTFDIDLITSIRVAVVASVAPFNDLILVLAFLRAARQVWWRYIRISGITGEIALRLAEACAEEKSNCNAHVTILTRMFGTTKPNEEGR